MLPDLTLRILLGLILLSLVALAVEVGLMLHQPQQQAASTRWVAPGGSGSSCTQAAPCGTIAAAVSAAAAGDTVNVVSGNYALAPWRTYTAGLTYRCTDAAGALARQTCKLQPANGTANNATLWENQGQNVVIDGFEIDGRTPDGKNSVRVGLYSTPAGTGPVTMQNNHVHHVYQKACSEGGAGLLSDAYSTPNAVVHFLNNHAHDVGPATKCNTVHGIYLSTNGDAINNLSYRNSGWGITTWHDAKANRIAHNTVHGNLSGGIAAGAGDFYHPPQPWTGSLVNNIAVDNAEYGIVLGGGGQVAPNQVVSNNVMHGNGTQNYLNNSGVAGGSCQNCSEAQPVFAGTGDWHLKAGSPGLDQAAPSNVRQDIDGISRPQASAADVGAYETASGPPPTPSGGGNASIVFVPASSCTGLPNGAAYNAAGTVKVCP